MKIIGPAQDIVDALERTSLPVGKEILFKRLRLDFAGGKLTISSKNEGNTARVKGTFNFGAEGEGSVTVEAAELLRFLKTHKGDCTVTFGDRIEIVSGKKTSTVTSEAEALDAVWMPTIENGVAQYKDGPCEIVLEGKAPDFAAAIEDAELVGKHEYHIRFGSGIVVENRGGDAKSARVETKVDGKANREGSFVLGRDYVHLFKAVKGIVTLQTMTEPGKPVTVTAGNVSYVFAPVYETTN